MSLSSTAQEGRAHSAPPPPDLVDDCPEWTVEQVFDHTTVYHARQRERDEILISWVGYGDEYNTVELAKNVPNSAELVQDYWLTLPADCRLAAMAVTTYLPGI